MQIPPNLKEKDITRLEDALGQAEIENLNLTRSNDLTHRWNALAENYGSDELQEAYQKLQSKNKRRNRLIGFGLIGKLILSGCGYFFLDSQIDTPEEAIEYLTDIGENSETFGRNQRYQLITSNLDRTVAVRDEKIIHSKDGLEIAIYKQSSAEEIFRTYNRVLVISKDDQPMEAYAFMRIASSKKTSFNPTGSVIFDGENVTITNERYEHRVEFQSDLNNPVSSCNASYCGVDQKEIDQKKLDALRLLMK